MENVNLHMKNVRDVEETFILEQILQKNTVQIVKK